MKSLLLGYYPSLPAPRTWKLEHEDLCYINVSKGYLLWQEGKPSVPSLLAFPHERMFPLQGGVSFPPSIWFSCAEAGKQPLIPCRTAPVERMCGPAVVKLPEVAEVGGISAVALADPPSGPRLTLSATLVQRLSKMGALAPTLGKGALAIF